VLSPESEIREEEPMSDLHELHQAWLRADARLHAHLASHHRSHLSTEPQARVSDVEAEMGDDVLGDPGELEAAAREAQSTYGAYTMALHGLGQGMG
jgi:hypothetical protein